VHRLTGGYTGVIVKPITYTEKAIGVKVTLIEDEDAVKIKSVKDVSSKIDIDVFLQKLEVDIKDIKAK